MKETIHLSSLRLPLFLTRLSIFLFLLPWQLMRFSKPESINNISQKYYKFSMPEIGSTLTGVLMMALLIAFLVGFQKRLSYGLVALLHGIGTAMTIPNLIRYIAFAMKTHFWLSKNSARIQSYLRAVSMSKARRPITRHIGSSDNITAITNRPNTQCLSVK